MTDTDHWRAPDGLIHRSSGSMGGHSLMVCEFNTNRHLPYGPASFVWTDAQATCLWCVANTRSQK